MTVALYATRGLVGAGIGLGFDIARRHADKTYRPPFYKFETVKSALTAIALTAIGLTFGQPAMIGALAGTLIVPLLRHTWMHNPPPYNVFDHLLGASHPGDLLGWRLLGLVSGAVAGELFKML